MMRAVQVFITVSQLVFGITFTVLYTLGQSVAHGHAAVMQAAGMQNGDASQVAAANAVGQTNWVAVVWFIVVALIALVWLVPLAWSGRHRKWVLPFMLIVPLILTACGSNGNQVRQRVVGVGASQTAFVVNALLPTDQQQLTASTFANAKKVLAGQVTIQYRQVRSKQDNRLGQNDQWDNWATDNYVYLLDRAQVTKEWTPTSTTGTGTSDQSFHVQSAESIKFSIGMNCTAQVTESDAARFLTIYAGTGRTEVKPEDKNLQDLPAAVWDVGAIGSVMDSNVRGAFQGRLLRDFSSHSMDDDNKLLGSIIDGAVKDVAAEFAANGLTLENCGAHGGIVYDQPAIQDAANQRFVAEQQANAQAITNQRNIDQAKADAAANKARQDQELSYVQSLSQALKDNPNAAQYIAAQKWDGKAPQTVVGGNSNAPYIIGGK